MEECPDRDRLSEYCLGAASGTQLERLKVHIDACISCAERVASMDGVADGLVYAIRQAATAPQASDADLPARIETVLLTIRQRMLSEGEAA
jgi:hypothetical protein